MSKSLRDYCDEEGFIRPGDLALVSHPGGGYVFAVVDDPTEFVIWGDVRMRADCIDGMLFLDPGDADRAAGLLVGRRFGTPEAALAACEPYRIRGGS
jgi:hypothetical protein